MKTDALEQLSLPAKFTPQNEGNSVSEGLSFKTFQGSMPPDPLETLRLGRLTGFKIEGTEDNFRLATTLPGCKLQLLGGMPVRQ